MNQRDGFASGFLTGTIIGGIVGGVIGALLASQNANYEAPGDLAERNSKSSDNNKLKRRQLKAAYSDQSIETARRSLEDKIAQLNDTIDEVRLTLGQVNGNQADSERTPQDS
jgi:TolA-binding protein